MADPAALLSVENIIDLIGVSALARHLGHRNPSTVSSWKLRSSIPVSYWPKVIEAARAGGEGRITIEVLAAACAARDQGDSAPTSSPSDPASTDEVAA